MTVQSTFTQDLLDRDSFRVAPMTPLSPDSQHLHPATNFKAEAEMSTGLLVNSGLITPIETSKPLPSMGLIEDMQPLPGMESLMSNKINDDLMNSAEIFNQNYQLPSFQSGFRPEYRNYQYTQFMNNNPGLRVGNILEFQDTCIPSREVLNQENMGKEDEIYYMPPQNSFMAGNPQQFIQNFEGINMSHFIDSSSSAFGSILPAQLINRSRSQTPHLAYIPSPAENQLDSSDRYAAISAQHYTLPLIDAPQRGRPRRKDVPETGKKRLVCDFPGCGKTFPRLYNLKSHIFCHTKIKAHECPNCSSKFARKHDLQRHIRTIHSGSSIYECPLCQKGFKKVDALRKHLVSEEGVEATPELVARANRSAKTVTFL